MDTTAAANGPEKDGVPLLHPRLAWLDPQVRGERAEARRTLGARIRVIAGAFGACLTVTFAAHAVHAAPTGNSSALSREGALTQPSGASRAAAGPHVVLS
jgi:hypothetical protein